MKALLLIGIYLIQLTICQNVDHSQGSPRYYQLIQHFGQQPESESKKPVIISGKSLSDSVVIAAASGPIEENVEEVEPRTNTGLVKAKRVIKKVKKFFRRNNLWKSIEPIDEDGARNVDSKKILSDTDISDMKTDWKKDVMMLDKLDESPVDLLQNLMAQRENIDKQIQHILMLKNAERKLQGEELLQEPEYTICGKTKLSKFYSNLEQPIMPTSSIDIQFGGRSGAQILLNGLTGVKMNCRCSFVKPETDKIH